VNTDKENAMPRFTLFLLALIVTFFTATCARITVNVYFPAAEIQNAAAQIEREVRSDKENLPPLEKGPEKPHQGSFLWPSRHTVHLAFTPPSAMAQAPDINITTPAIRHLIDSRKARYSSLVPLFNNCVLGENNRGLLDLRSLQGLSLQDKARAKTLLEQENRDRQNLYQELATANQLPANRLDEIASIFAKVNLKEARPGWCIQDDQGNWKKK
jgi:uncharacterized protein YdbL (DUF1318 family)